MESILCLSKWSPTALRPWHLLTRFVGRNPPKRTLLRQGYGGYPPRIHPRVYTRGFLRRRVTLILPSPTTATQHLLLTDILTSLVQVCGGATVSSRLLTGFEG